MFRCVAPLDFYEDFIILFRFCLYSPCLQSVKYGPHFLECAKLPEAELVAQDGAAGLGVREAIVPAGRIQLDGPFDLSLLPIYSFCRLWAARTGGLPKEWNHILLSNAIIIGQEIGSARVSGHLGMVEYRRKLNGVPAFHDRIRRLRREGFHSSRSLRCSPVDLHAVHNGGDNIGRGDLIQIVMEEIAVKYLIKSGCGSAAILDRWVLKIDSLEEKKRHYETILWRELDGLDDEFTALKGYSQELKIRAQGIRARKTA